jgi:hypothetical protein
MGVSLINHVVTLFICDYVMVTRAFCDLCGKEIVDVEPDEDESYKETILATIKVSEYENPENLFKESAWDHYILHLCHEDYLKFKVMMKRE